MADDVRLVHLGQGRRRRRGARRRAADRARPCGGCGILPPPRPGRLRSNSVGWSLRAGDAHRAAPTGFSARSGLRRSRHRPAGVRSGPPAGRRRSGAMSPGVVISVVRRAGGRRPGWGRPARRPRARGPARKPRSIRRRWTRARVLDADRELVEVRAGMEPLDTDGGERPPRARRPARRRSRRRRAGRAARSREVDGRGKGEQCLVRADVAGGLVAPDVLLARAKRHDEGPLAVEVGGHADQPARDLAHERIGRRQDAEVRAAVLRRDARGAGPRRPRCRPRTRPAGPARPARPAR